LEKEVVMTTLAPVYPPISQAVKAGGLIFVSGSIPTDPKTGKMVLGDMKTQIRQVFKNLKAILEAAGSSLDNVVKATVFLRDGRDFEVMNEIWRETFPASPPARSTIFAGLVGEAAVEIEIVALASKS
jgi:2-iminobutanoate/2-iminopropanoate deaminase